MHWNGVLRMKCLLTAFVLFETFYFWLFPNVEGVCFQRNIVAKGRMLTVLCLKQADINYILLAILLLWITLKGPSNFQNAEVSSQNMNAVSHHLREECIKELAGAELIFVHSQEMLVSDDYTN